jgi:hypothetical protein
LFYIRKVGEHAHASYESALSRCLAFAESSLVFDALPSR